MVRPKCAEFTAQKIGGDLEDGAGFKHEGKTGLELDRQELALPT